MASCPQGFWLESVMTGYFAYHAMAGNLKAIYHSRFDLGPLHGDLDPPRTVSQTRVHGAGVTRCYRLDRYHLSSRWSVVSKPAEADGFEGLDLDPGFWIEDQRIRAA